MQKAIRFIALFLLLSLTVSLFAACSASMEDVAGLYEGSYTYNGNEFHVKITLTEEGTYTRVTYKNGSHSSTNSGEYEVEGNDVLLYDSDSLTHHGSWTRYTFNRKGTLENNGHIFIRV